MRCPAAGCLASIERPGRRPACGCRTEELARAAQPSGVSLGPELPRRLAVASPLEAFQEVAWHRLHRMWIAHGAAGGN